MEYNAGWYRAIAPLSVGRGCQEFCVFRLFPSSCEGHERTLLNYDFMIKDLPSLILDDENQNVYYEVLLVYDEQEDVEAMRTFIEFSLIKT